MCFGLLIFRIFFCPCGNWDDCLVGVNYPWNIKRMCLRHFQLIDGKLFVSEMSFGDLVLSNEIVSNLYWRGFCGIDGGSLWAFIVLEVLWQHWDQQKLRQTLKSFPTTHQVKLNFPIESWSEKPWNFLFLCRRKVTNQIRKIVEKLIFEILKETCVVFVILW